MSGDHWGRITHMYFTNIQLILLIKVFQFLCHMRPLGSRRPSDKKNGLDRMEKNGVTLINYEMLFF